MFRMFLITLLVISCVSLSSGWIINDLNFTQIQNKSVEINNDIESKEDQNQVLPAEEVDAMDKINLIFPGTKWCGPGNIAKNESDLGEFADTDRCCREHDNCPDVILAGQTAHNLTNTAFYTRLNCKCDERFYKCLKTVNSEPSNIIGNVYFNLLGTQCFRNDYQVTGCSKRGGFGNSKCLEYTYDKNSKKLYQWFDLPIY